MKCQVYALVIGTALVPTLSHGMQDLKWDNTQEKAFTSFCTQFSGQEIQERILDHYLLAQLRQIRGGLLAQIKAALASRIINKKTNNKLSLDTILTTCQPFTEAEITKLLFGTFEITTDPFSTFKKIPLHIGLTLVKHGANPDEPRDPDQDTSLHLAVARNDLELVQKLFALGATSDAQNKWGQPPYTFTHASQKQMRKLLMPPHPDPTTHQSAAYVAPLETDESERSV